MCDKENTRDVLINELDEIMTNILPQLEGDPVTFIGSTFLKYGEEKPYLNNCIVLDTCKDMENTEIERKRHII